MNLNKVNAGVLAYIGDAVYEVEIRKFLINKNINNVNKLQKLAINYVSATSQSKILERLLEKEILTEKELYTVGRARNYKPDSKPKHADIKTYKKATALEALFGILYLEDNTKRIKEIMEEIIGD